MRNKKIILAIVAGLLALGLILAVLEKKQIINLINRTPKTAINDGPTPEQKAEDDRLNADAKKKALDDTPQEAPTNTATNLDSQVTLTAQQETNGTVTIFTKLAQVSSGTCKLEVTNNGKSNTQTAPVIYQPEYSICGGFSVPISSVGNGNWTIKLTVDAGGKTGSKTITTEVK